MGVPQGWALSPIITNFIMEEVLTDTKATSVNFLDDGVLGLDDGEDTGSFWAILVGRLQEYGLGLKPSKFK